jgi:hypothetical protein
LPSRIIWIGALAGLAWVQIKPPAVAIARTKNAARNSTYRVLYVLCPDDAQALHEEMVMRIFTCGGVASTVARRSRDGDTEYRAAAWEKGSIGSRRTVVSGRTLLCPTDHTVWTAPGLARVFQHQITSGMVKKTI